MSSGVADHNPAAEFWHRKYMEERIHSTNVIDSLSTELFLARDELRKRAGADQIAKVGNAVSTAIRNARSAQTNAPMVANLPEPEPAQTGMAPNLDEDKVS